MSVLKLKVGNEWVDVQSIKGPKGDQGDPIDVQVNGTSVVQNGVANIPIAEANPGRVGVVKTGASMWINPDNGIIGVNVATSTHAKAGIAQSFFNTPNIQHESVFYGLAKAAGNSDQSSSSNAVGTYTADALVKIQKMLGIYEAPWELIREDSVTNASEADVVISVDGNGDSFELTDAHVWVWFPTQNNEAKDAGGLISFYYDSSNFYSGTIDQKTVAANSTETIAYAGLTQDHGLIDIKSLTFGNTGNINTLRYKSRGSNTDHNMPMRIGNISINKIVINKITGTLGFRVFGRRKWTL